MASDRKQPQSNSIPIRFFDGSDSEFEETAEPETEAPRSAESPGEAPDQRGEGRTGEAAFGGPEVAELVASRAELKRLQAALAESQETSARRQADFENFRKRVDRERKEAYSRAAGEVARKLLPVLDNLGRALDAERTVEANESKEFRDFLHGVELISKQLHDVLESLGVQPIASVGERFDPHIHEAVVTEPSEEFEPDTVMEELARGYRIGDRLLRPAMVKVASRKESE
jgi:molecular chaperone GrpE